MPGGPPRIINPPPSTAPKPKSRRGEKLARKDEGKRFYKRSDVFRRLFACEMRDSLTLDLTARGAGVAGAMRGAGVAGAIAVTQTPEAAAPSC